MSVRSMTGYARARASSEKGEVVVTLKSVNHRALDIHAHLTAELDPYDPALRSIIKQHVTRGHLDLRVNFVRTRAAEGAGLNKALVEAYIGAARQLREEFGIQGDLDLNGALRLPGLLTPPNGEEDEELDLEPLLRGALEQALGSLNQFREREGAGLAEAMRECCAAIRADAEDMEGLRTEVLPALRARLEERLTELLKGAPIEPQRLAQEAALLADRSDIAEEIARLKVHATELDLVLQKGGEVGKKLDFLLQEMNRETTTVLSKTSGLGEIGLKLTDAALDAKSQIEKIREQALNLE
jgi:uncharacterized protein (TIGR00255 family)